MKQTPLPTGGSRIEYERIEAFIKGIDALRASADYTPTEMFAGMECVKADLITKMTTYQVKQEVYKERDLLLAKPNKVLDRAMKMMGMKDELNLDPDNEGDGR